MRVMRIRREELKDLRVVAKTRDTSPPIIEIFAKTLVSAGIISAAVSPLWNTFWDDVRRKVIKEHERERLLSRLFGFCRNADFIIGARYPGEEEEEKLWSNYSISAVYDAITNLSRTFSTRPHIPEDAKTKQPPSLDLEMNIVSIGGPIPNIFTRKVMGIENPWDKASFPYSFNLQPPGCEEKDFRKLQKRKPEPNWSIMKSKTGEEIYIPERYQEETLRRDYGMIIKTRSIAEEAPPGRRNLILAGCHGPGSVAAASALADRGILSQIWEKTGDKDFQALIMCEVSDDEPEYVELLEIIPLR